jgi:hypothetical protein
MPAADFARFEALTRRGHAIDPFRAPDGDARKGAEQTYQLADLERSIRYCRDTLGLGRALDTFAQLFFGQGSTLGGVIEFPGALTREQAKDLSDSFEEQHRSVRRSHRPGVLFGGAKYSQTSAAPNEAQMLESRQYSTEEIARAFRCPPALLGVTTPGAMSYASVEMNGIHFVTYCLRPYIVKIEDAYSNLIPGDAFVKINVDGLLRGDQATRYASFSTGIQSGFLSINDIHRLEDMPPADGGDVYRVPLANVVELHVEFARARDARRHEVHVGVHGRRDRYGEGRVAGREQREGGRDAARPRVERARQIHNGRREERLGVVAKRRARAHGAQR